MRERLKIDSNYDNVKPKMASREVNNGTVVDPINTYK